MKSVLKYSVPISDFATTLEMVVGSNIVAAGMQEESSLRLWVEVPDIDHVVLRKFQVIGTGSKVPINAQHIATVQNRPFVWHLYEVLD